MNPNMWAQLRNLTVEELIRALEKDGAIWDDSHGGVRVYKLKSGFKITIHYHPKKTFGPQLLSELLEKIGWTEADLKRLKLIK
jgi:predicted RNA binding protein YcfA (HicA-like mRNA interferase family)